MYSLAEPWFRVKSSVSLGQLAFSFVDNERYTLRPIAVGSHSLVSFVSPIVHSDGHLSRPPTLFSPSARLDLNVFVESGAISPLAHFYSCCPLVGMPTQTACKQINKTFKAKRSTLTPAQANKSTKKQWSFGHRLYRNANIELLPTNSLHISCVTMENMD